jgi:hypothetical protein
MKPFVKFQHSNSAFDFDGDQKKCRLPKANAGRVGATDNFKEDPPKQWFAAAALRSRTARNIKL